MSDLLKAMKKGLDSKTAPLATMKILSSFVRAVPIGTEIGNFLVLDLGSTSFHVLLIKSDRRNVEMDETIFCVPDNITSGTSEELSDHIAECMVHFMEERDLKHDGMLLFPCQKEDLTYAKLISWTKGFSESNVENKELSHCCMKRANVARILTSMW
ncbi:Hexokinase [Onchocerca flexuosa]|uniref:Phosphotransferase n=2 Tax=Onchocerca flexuosa TaxID=387005 RepID=A0A183H4P5_9BILA|nr:Hexokinase [Onchocerca flexuosa]VDO33030.1 unnamed protein product [Onchocerca flexuosa]